MSYRYTWIGDTGSAHPLFGELVKGQVYTSQTELAGPGWAAYSETKPEAMPAKPGKEKNK